MTDDENKQLKRAIFKVEPPKNALVKPDAMVQIAYSMQEYCDKTLENILLGLMPQDVRGLDVEAKRKWIDANGYSIRKPNAWRTEVVKGDVVIDFVENALLRAAHSPIGQSIMEEKYR
jgi:hypothetical protein